MPKSFEATNLVEQIVDLKLRDLLEQHLLCSCNECYSTIRAMALNKMAPQYAKGHYDEVLKKVEVHGLQSSIDALFAIVEAVEEGKGHIHHQS